MKRALLVGVLLLAGPISCASRQRHDLDSPLFRGCQKMCREEGKRADSVTETEDDVYCDCKKPAGHET